MEVMSLFIVFERWVWVKMRWYGVVNLMVFFLCSFYKILSSKGRTAFPGQSIWIPGVPTKVSFVVWLAALNQVLTINNLICRRHVLVNWCCMC